MHPAVLRCRRDLVVLIDGMLARQWATSDTHSDDFYRVRHALYRWRMSLI